MPRISPIFSILLLSAAAFAAKAQQATVTTVNYAGAQANQVTVGLSAAVHHKFFTLSNPSRLVLDLDNTAAPVALKQPAASHPLFRNVRSGAHNGNDLRMVFELKAEAESKGFLIKNQSNAEIQLALTPKAMPAAKPAKLEKPVEMPVAVVSKKTRTPEPEQPALKPVALSQPTKRGRDIIVAIDAGHGGKDVGAQGGNGTQEKDVVFAIAKRLEGMVNAQNGMRAVMIRKGDYFVKLHDRVRIAEAAKADLFVSIHADAFNDPSTHGSSVYTLSNKGASSATARWLADSENSADGEGAAHEERSGTLASVLQDLSNSAAKEASQNIGSKVLRSVKSVGHLHRSSVQKAGFVVLKSPVIPSILVETAFISNPEEERHLTSRSYQDKMASAVFGGIMAHFRQYAPANTLMAQLSRGVKVPRLAAAAQPEVIAKVGKPLTLAKADLNGRQL